MQFPDPNMDGPVDMILGGESPASPPVLLLPPSTTSASPTKSKINNGSSLYPAVQDMDCVGDPTDEESKVDASPAEEGSPTTVAAVAPAVASAPPAVPVAVLNPDPPPAIFPPACVGPYSPVEAAFAPHGGNRRRQ